MPKEKQKRTNVSNDASEQQLQSKVTVDQAVSHPADVETGQIFTAATPTRLGKFHDHATRFRQSTQAEDPQHSLTSETAPIDAPLPSLDSLAIFTSSSQPGKMITGAEIRSLWEASLTPRTHVGRIPAHVPGERIPRTPILLTQQQIRDYTRTPDGYGPSYGYGSASLLSRTSIPVGKVTALEIATQLAPHVAGATTETEFESRFQSAKTTMTLQLESQRLESDAAIQFEKQKNLDLGAQLAALQQQMITSRAQPILVSSSSSHSPPTSPSSLPRKKNGEATQSISPHPKATSQDQIQALEEHDLQQAEYALIVQKQLAILLPQAMSDIMQTSRTAQALPSVIPAPTSDRAPAPLAPQPLPTAPAADPIPQSLLDMFKARMQRQNEKRKASTAGNSPRQAQSTPLVKTPSLSKSEQVRQAEITKQQLRIDKAQQCLETLKNPAATVRKPRAKESARSLEKKIAALTKDKDLLKHGSDKIKSEEASEDDAEEIRREQGTKIAFHNIMNPSKRIPLRNSQGHVNSPFIKGDKESESEGASDDSEDEGESEIDDDRSPDYVDPLEEAEGHERTLPKASQERTLSKEEWQQWQSLKNGPTTASTDLPALLSAIIGTQKKTSHDGRMQVALNPPPHGEWDDVNHFMTIYLPLYEKYEASCGTLAESIFSAYSLTQKKRLSKLFTKQAGGHTTQVTIEQLQAMSNETFTKMLCKEKGYKTSTLTEDALKAITWKGKFTAKSAWINHETNWEDCLAQSSKKGAVDTKRLIVLYRQSIPEPFIRKHLESKRFESWQQCHNYMAEEMIIDPDFLTEWNEDIRTRQPTPSDKPKNPPHGATQPHKNGSDQPRAQPTHPLADAQPAQDSQIKDGALSYKDKFGKLNVNPNLIIDLDLNPGKLICSRCGLIHRWLEEFCTSFKNKLDQLIEPKLTFEQIKKATIARWNAGFFAAKDPNSRPHRDSPSVQAAASAATDTRVRLSTN
jgi:hypothetical protein